MKRVVFNFLVIVAMSLSAVLVSCSNGKVHLLESITYSDGRFEKYEYDNENRIAKITQYDMEGNLTFLKTFSYDGNELVKEVVTIGINHVFGASSEYFRNGNKIVVKTNDSADDITTTTIDLDNDGFPTKVESMRNLSSYLGIYEIHDGNLTKHSYKSTVEVAELLLEGISDYKYDNKKSPLYNCKTPKWWWIYSCVSTQNNEIEVIDVSNMGEKRVENRYEYDKAGYPTKCTTKDSDGEYVKEFKYK